MKKSGDISCTISGDSAYILPFGFDEEDSRCTALKIKLLQTLNSYIQSGINVFYSNCEYGVPLWSLEILSALKMHNDISINIVVPYEEQAVKWVPQWRERYFNLHSKADGIYMLNHKFSNDCYAKADEFMIDKSSHLIYAGSDRKSHICSYAENASCRIDFISTGIIRI